MTPLTGPNSFLGQVGYRLGVSEQTVWIGIAVLLVGGYWLMRSGVRR
jgi:hypothetical protein